MNIAFHQEVAKLKTLLRQGWVDRGIPDPESVADHMYASQFIAYDLAKELGVDPVSCAFMMMVHDLVEAKVGDITPASGVSREEKAALEIKAAQELAKLSSNPEFLAIFLEYQRKETLRAQICNDADKLECLMQVLVYSRQYPVKQPLLESFWPDLQKKLMTAPGKRIFEELWQQKLVIPRYDAVLQLGI